MKYLKETKSFCLNFQASKLEIVRYSDLDYQGCVDTIKSSYDFIFMSGGGQISWKSML